MKKQKGNNMSHFDTVIIGTDTLEHIERITIRTAIRDVLYNANVYDSYADLVRRNWLTKKQIAIDVCAKFPKVAKNDESIFREIRRLVEEGEIETQEDIYTKVKRYTIKERC